MAAEKLHQPPPGYPVVTPEEHKAALEEQQRNIDAMLARDTLVKKPKCYDPIKARIAGIPFAFPRGWGVEVVTPSDETIDYLDRRCEIKDLGAVQSYQWIHGMLGNAATRPDYQPEYDRSLHLIEEGRKEGRSIILPNGMERIVKGYLYIYILPQSAAPTYDGKPVTFRCSGGDPVNGDFAPSNNCHTSYIFKKDLVLAYRFFRNDFPVEGHIEADQKQRAWVESLIIKENK